MLKTKILAGWLGTALFVSQTAFSQDYEYEPGPANPPVFGEFSAEIDVTLRVSRIFKDLGMPTFKYGVSDTQQVDISSEYPTSLKTTFKIKSKGIQLQDYDNNYLATTYTYGVARQVSENYPVTLNETPLLLEKGLSSEELHEFLGLPLPQGAPYLLHEHNSAALAGPYLAPRTPAITLDFGSFKYFGMTPESVTSVAAAEAGGEYVYLQSIKFQQYSHDFTFAYAQSLEGFLSEFVKKEWEQTFADFETRFKSDEGLYGIALYRLQTKMEVDDIRITVVDEVKPATCTYKKYTEWDGGFVGAVYIKNDTDQPLQNWAININFADPVTIVGNWSSLLSGASPSYLATPHDWNNTIYPGQEINFGFQGTKLPGQTGNATINGSLCK